MKKTYSFVAKIACEGDFNEKYGEKLETLKTILTGKGMTKMSTPKALPLSAQPFVFQRLEGFIGKYYQLSRRTGKMSYLRKRICSDKNQVSKQRKGDLLPRL